MTSFSAALARTSRSIRRAARIIIVRLTRKANLKLALTVSLPPFFKFAVDYKSDLSKPGNRIPAPANDDAPRRRRRKA